MAAAVQSRDIQTAQQNLATVQQDTQGIQAATGSSNTQQNPYQSTLKTDLSNLINAVQGGNIGTVQSALQTMQQDSHAIADSGSSNVASNQPNSPFLNDLMNLLNSVVSGNSTGVQNAATALQQDLQAAFGTTPSCSTQATSASTTSDQSQNSFVNDLLALISAAGSNDTTGMQRHYGNHRGDWLHRHHCSRQHRQR
jgi:ribosomal protein S20